VDWQALPDIAENHAHEYQEQGKPVCEWFGADESFHTPFFSRHTGQYVLYSFVCSGVSGYVLEPCTTMCALACHVPGVD
jgi:hypothetical protein